MQGEECKIDASETFVRDKDISTFGYYLNGKEILNEDGNICSGCVGSFVFNYPDTFEIEVRGKYFGNDNIGSKTATVVVSKNETASTPTSTLTSTPTRAQPTCAPQPTTTCCYISSAPPTSVPETSGMGFGSAAIATLIIAIAVRRKYKH